MGTCYGAHQYLLSYRTGIPSGGRSSAEKKGAFTVPPQVAIVPDVDEEIVGTAACTVTTSGSNMVGPVACYGQTIAGTGSEPEGRQMVATTYSDSVVYHQINLLIQK